MDVTRSAEPLDGRSSPRTPVGSGGVPGRHRRRRWQRRHRRGPGRGRPQARARVPPAVGATAGRRAGGEL